MLNPASSATDWETCRALALIARDIYNDDWETACLSHARNSWGEPQRGEFTPRVDSTPRFILLVYADTIICVCEGTTSFVQASNLATSYLRPTVPDLVTMHVNGTAWTYAYYGMNAAITRNAVGKRNLVMAGHSLGGAIVQCCALMQKLAGTIPTITFSTFGQPAAGGRMFGNEMASIRGQRLMNNNDAICCVWPTFTQAPLLNITQGGLNLFWTQQYEQCGFGFRYNGDATWTLAYQPILESAIAEIDLASVFWGYAEDEESPHAMKTYVANIEATIASIVPGQNPAPFQGLPPKPPEEPQRQRVRGQLPIIQRALIERRNGFRDPPPLIPKRQLFVARKAGGYWGVTFGGAWISWGMKRRRATHTAFLGNTFMKEYIRTPLAYPNVFDASFSAFLDAAQDPSSGIVPQLHTNPLALSTGK